MSSECCWSSLGTLDVREEGALGSRQEWREPIPQLAAWVSRSWISVCACLFPASVILDGKAFVFDPLLPLALQLLLQKLTMPPRDSGELKRHSLLKRGNNVSSVSV